MIRSALLRLSLVSTLFGAFVPAQDTSVIRTPPPQRLDVPFRLFPTDNIWTQILLDSRDGRLWQVSYGAADKPDPNSKSIRCKLPINADPLVETKDASVGRFTLYPTYNMWTFVLLDQFDGRTWQCQFNPEDDKRFLELIPENKLVIPPGGDTSGVATDPHKK
jgi:hypothetical protein